MLSPKPMNNIGTHLVFRVKKSPAGSRAKNSLIKLRERRILLICFYQCMKYAPLIGIIAPVI